MTETRRLSRRDPRRRCGWVFETGQADEEGTLERLLYAGISRYSCPTPVAHRHNSRNGSGQIPRRTRWFSG
jgi:hypothetical protein